MIKIQVKKGKYPALFGGIGFHNNEAVLYPLIEKEHFNQLLCKCYREIAPGFMRTFAGYDDWTHEAMDNFAEYYEKMQKVTDTPMYFAAAKGKMHFSKEEMQEYCENIAKNLEYLKKEKGVNHLSYYCFSNEMSQCGWGDLMQNLPLFKQYHEMLYRSFQNHKLDIGLLATDASEYENWSTVDWAMENMHRITEDYCVHIYERQHDIFDKTLYSFFYDKCDEIVKKAIQNDGKRIILGEYGMQKKLPQLEFGAGCVIDVCRWQIDKRECAYLGVALADMAFAAINAGIFALAIWTYTDYPDPYSCKYSNDGGYAQKWGSIEKFISGTTDVKYNKYGVFTWEDNGEHKVKPHYWALAPLMKLFKKNTKVLDINLNDEDLHCCGILNRDGSVTVGIINRKDENVIINLESELFDKEVRVIEFDPQNVPENKFGDIQEPVEVLQKDKVEFELKAGSLTFFTTDYKQKAKTVKAKHVRKRADKLCWCAINDKKHCYYRVYASDKRNFTPSKNNQIASTVGLSIPIKDKKLFYKVLSVDTWGNV